VSVHGLALFLPSNFLTRLIPNDIAALCPRRTRRGRRRKRNHTAGKKGSC
jgi:hypothetical protein